MADTKISALTAAAGALLTDEYAVNQGGVSKKVTGTQIAAIVVGGGGALILLEQHTAVPSTALSFTASISATYDEYVFELINVVPVTNDHYLHFRLSDDGGASYKSTNYLFAQHYHSTGGDHGVFNQSQITSGTTFANVCSDVSSTAAQGGVSGRVRLYNPNQAAAYVRALVDVSYFHTNGAHYRFEGHSIWTGLSAITAVQFFFQSVSAVAGNVAAGGTIRCYGVAK